jgi:hypothetical protein
MIDEAAAASNAHHGVNIALLARMDLGLLGAGYAYALCKATNALLLLGWMVWQVILTALPGVVLSCKADTLRQF